MACLVCHKVNAEIQNIDNKVTFSKKKLFQFNAPTSKMSSCFWIWIFHNEIWNIACFYTIFCPCQCQLLHWRHILLLEPELGANFCTLSLYYIKSCFYTKICPQQIWSCRNSGHSTGQSWNSGTMGQFFVWNHIPNSNVTMYKNLPTTNFLDGLIQHRASRPHPEWPRPALVASGQIFV